MRSSGATGVDGRREAAMRAGVVAGLAALATFLLIHHLWIVPIWFIAPAGGVLAAVGGAAVGAAYADLEPHLPRRPLREISVIAVFGLVLLPGVVIAELRGPIYAMSGAGGGTLLVSGADAVVAIVVGLVLAPLLAGASLGWLITRDLRAAGSLALASLAMALGPGHNIPMLGGTPAVAKELLILGAVVGVAAVVLVVVHVSLTKPASQA
jgi:hypothetical protein